MINPHPILILCASSISNRLSVYITRPPCEVSTQYDMNRSRNSFFCSKRLPQLSTNKSDTDSKFQIQTNKIRRFFSASSLNTQLTNMTSTEIKICTQRSTARKQRSTESNLKIQTQKQLQVCRTASKQLTVIRTRIVKTILRTRNCAYGARCYHQLNQRF